VRQLSLLEPAVTRLPVPGVPEVAYLEDNVTAAKERA